MSVSNVIFVNVINWVSLSFIYSSFDALRKS